MVELIDVKCIYMVDDDISKYSKISNVYNDNELYDIKAVSKFNRNIEYYIKKLKYEDVIDAGEVLDEFIEKEEWRNITRLQSIIRGYVCRKRCKKIMINKEVDELIKKYCDGFLKDIKLLI